MEPEKLGAVQEAVMVTCDRFANMLWLGIGRERRRIEKREGASGGYI